MPDDGTERASVVSMMSRVPLPPLDAPLPPGTPLVAADLGYKEVTFALIKSHILATRPDVVGEIFWGLLQADIEVTVACRAKLSALQIETLYNEHLDRPYYPDLARSVGGEVIAMALRAPRVIGRWRAMLGVTNSLVAAADTLRGQFGSRIVVADNVAHGSDSLASARRELSYFFPQHVQLWQGA